MRRYYILHRFFITFRAPCAITFCENFLLHYAQVLHFATIFYYIMRRYYISQRFFITFRAGITFRNIFFITICVSITFRKDFVLRYAQVLHLATFITLCILTHVVVITGACTPDVLQSSCFNNDQREKLTHFLVSGCCARIPHILKGKTRLYTDPGYQNTYFLPYRYRGIVQLFERNDSFQF